MTETYQLDADGDGLPVVARHEYHDVVARVLFDVEAAGEWVLHVVSDDDAVVQLVERHDAAHDAFARLAALAYVLEHDELLVHDPDDPIQLGHFRREVTRFLARTTTRSAP